jgi:phosphoglycolate phosphatase-like HAD superfamily hydrolase
MKLLRTPKLIFWDFDGVIKDSVEVKTRAFAQLFEHHGAGLSNRIRDHHETHGGMSRFEKIPRYLEWAGISATPELVEEYCRRFAQLTLQGIINAPWVPGVEAFLRGNPYQQKHVVVTATPQEDIEVILTALNLRSCFVNVFGGPFSKQEAIRATLANGRIDPQLCLMIGDATADRDAAQANQVPFLLRRHTTNGQVFKDYAGDSVENFA